MGLHARLAWLAAEARARWNAMLASPGGPGLVARGAAAGAFAAMLPVFGLHILVALAVALLVRGSRAAAATACVLVGNPLTHAAILPLAYGIGREALHGGAAAPARLPGWLRDALPVAEETLFGGTVLGVVAAAVVFLLVRRALAGRGGMPG